MKFKWIQCILTTLAIFFFWVSAIAFAETRTAMSALIPALIGAIPLSLRFLFLSIEDDKETKDNEDKKEIKIKDKDKVKKGYNLCEGDVDKEHCKDILNNWIDWEQVDETGDVDFAIDQLRSLHTEGEITNDEYDYITVNWDNLLESCQTKDKEDKRE